MLANLAVAEVDIKIAAIAEDVGGTYTRYADDIVLSLSDTSLENCRRIFNRVADVVTTAGFRLNRKKSFVRGPGARKVVTGLTINSDTPQLPRSVKDEIELAIYHIEKHGLLGHMAKRKSNSPFGYLSHMKGLIYYARSVDPTFGQKALANFRRVLLPYEELLNVFRDLAPATVDQSDYYFS